MRAVVPDVGKTTPKKETCNDIAQRKLNYHQDDLEPYLKSKLFSPVVETETGEGREIGGKK